MAQVGYNHSINGITTIKNIRIEGSIPGITNLKPRSNGSGNTAVKVSTEEVTFLGDLIMENVTVEEQFQKGLIRGEADPDYNGNKKWLVKDCEFKNIKIGGVCVNETNKGQYFTIDAGTTQNVTFSCGNTTPILKDPVISFTAPAQDASISGTYTVKVNAYDEDFGTTPGSGITSVLFQLMDISNPTTALYQETVTTSPFSWSLNTSNFPNGQYELRAGVQSEDFNITRKWAVVKPVTINNAAKDCAGVSGGTAKVDGCGICSGGTTGITPSSPKTWYKDQDNDSKGDPSQTKIACTKPAGYVAVAGDQCPDDGNKSIPGECGCGEPEGSCTVTGLTCNLPEYSPKTIYAQSGTEVIYLGRSYVNKWYSFGNIPGSSDVWQLTGFCGAQPLDCSNLSAWKSGTVYSSPGTKIIYKGSVYSNKWYSLNNTPGTHEAWLLEGPCAAFKNSLTPNVSVNVFPNPVTGNEVNIEFPILQSNVNVLMYNNFQKVVMSRKSVNTDLITVDISSLVPGTYTLVITTNEMVNSVQVVRY